MNQLMDKQAQRPLIVGIDWADCKHDLTIVDGRHVEHLQVDADPYAVEEVIAQLQSRAAGRKIAVCLEKGRVRIIYHLMHREDFVLYPVAPKQVARYRESFVSSSAKDDRGDSAYLARLLQERIDDLKPLRPDDPLTRRLALLCEYRRVLVNEKTRLIQQLTAKLKVYHPLPLLLPGKVGTPLILEFVRRFPDPRKAQKAHQLTLEKLFGRHGIKNEERVAQLIDQVRSTPLVTRDAALIEPTLILVRALLAQLKYLDKAIAEYEQEILCAMNRHPDAELFRALPGAGAALAPRLLTLYGSDRERYEHAEEVANGTGIAPVTVQSGKKRHVTRRRACPKFLLQTFHEFARCASLYCPWSGAYYRWQRSQGVAHHAALRKLATRWNRILFRMWKTSTPYDPDRYLNAMKAKNHPLLEFLITQ